MFAIRTGRGIYLLPPPPSYRRELCWTSSWRHRYLVIMIRLHCLSERVCGSPPAETAAKNTDCAGALNDEALRHLRYRAAPALPVLRQTANYVFRYLSSPKTRSPTKGCETLSLLGPNSGLERLLGLLCASSKRVTTSSPQWDERKCSGDDCSFVLY